MEIFFTPFATTIAAMVDLGESESRYYDSEPLFIIFFPRFHFAFNLLKKFVH
ncbi:hypothetical protein HanRHA438_Chr08g0348041 [Helianthus annuus]|nr:hypothetical protein HanRHA438_Chr08g0348041 [Helianthus annuus]